jgi:hypothetical protein
MRDKILSEWKNFDWRNLKPDAMHPKGSFFSTPRSENSTVRESRLISDRTPDPFDVAGVVVSTVEPRLKHSGVTTRGRVIRGLFDTPQVGAGGGDSFTAAWKIDDSTSLDNLCVGITVKPKNCVKLPHAISEGDVHGGGPPIALTDHMRW